MSIYVGFRPLDAELVEKSTPDSSNVRFSVVESSETDGLSNVKVLFSEERFG